jgi:hypothetical protein
VRRCYGLDGKRLNPPKDLSEKPRPDLRRGAFPFKALAIGRLNRRSGRLWAQPTATCHDTPCQRVARYSNSWFLLANG